MRVVALLATHNRWRQTHQCLQSYFSQDIECDIELAAVLVDDGSRDGTPTKTKSAFPEVTVISGDGSLYWAGAMAIGEAAAAALSPDALLWLNDDVILDPAAVCRMLEVSTDQEEQSIVVGALRDPVTGALTYSGVRRPGRHPRRTTLVRPGKDPIRVETFNGNVVLVPHELARRIGGIDGGFAHGAADFDYGLRAARMGVRSLLAPMTVGVCARDHPVPPWLLQDLPLRDRLAELLGPKGVPPRSSARFLRRHGGALWPAFWLAPYVRFVGLALGRDIALRSLRTLFRQFAIHARRVAGRDRSCNAR